MLLLMSLIMLAEKRETSPPIFVFRLTYFCPSWKRPSLCFQYVPTTVVCLLGSRAKIYTRLVGDSAVHTYFGRAPLLVGETAEVVLPSVTSTEFDSI